MMHGWTWDWYLYCYLAVGCPVHALMIYLDLNYLHFSDDQWARSERIRFFYAWFALGFMIGVCIWPIIVMAVITSLFLRGGRERDKDE